MDEWMGKWGLQKKIPFKIINYYFFLFCERVDMGGCSIFFEGGRGGVVQLLVSGN